MVIGDNGIIAKSKDARDNVIQMQNETANKREDLYDEIVSGKSQYETDGDVEVSLEVTKNSETSITATAEATDTTSQIISYTFYIRKITEDDSAYVIIKKSDKLENTATISNLEKDMGYKVKVVAMDKTGTSKTATKNIALGNVVKITVKGTNGPDAYPSILSVTAKSVMAKIDYIEMPSGEKIYSTNGKYTMKTVYNTTKNGPIVFTAYDIDGNSTQLEYEETNVINFETEWTFAEANTTITVPVTGTVDVYIDYGDGTKENITTANPTHTYAETGTYTMKISGKCGTFSFNDSTRDYITGLKKWGVLQNTQYSFSARIDGISCGCSKMAGTIPVPHEKSFANITTCYRLFGECTSLTGNIPENLLASAYNLVDCTNIFLNCSQLNGNIPEKLFAKNPKVTNFQSAFDGCDGLTGSIPEKLFENNTMVTIFRGTFANCDGLTGTIPENLFKNCTKVTIFENTFSNSPGLTGSLSASLFSNCSEVTTFYYTFYCCTGLEGTIPEDLFKNCTKVENFRNVFYYCSNLTGSVPENLFINCKEVTDFHGVFGNTGITGSIPENLFINCQEVTDFSHLFYNCMGLTGSIPEDLFKNCSKTISFEGTFYGANNLNGTIPESLFSNCPEVTTFKYTFNYCNNLTGSLPEGLFANCTNVISFHSTFADTGITGSIPENLFSNCPKVTTFHGVFRGCGITGEIPQNLFANCPEVTDFSESFAYCVYLKGNAPELWSRENVTSSYDCFFVCTNLENYADIPDGWK